MGGGHRKANPSVGKKGPLRGDRRREEVAGRKRIGKEYREKGQSHKTIEDGDPLDEFLPRERNILFVLVKRKVVGDKRPQVLEDILRVQRVSDEERDEFVATFRRKCEMRGWLTFYIGRDGREYVYINIDSLSVVQTYLDLSNP